MRYVSRKLGHYEVTEVEVVDGQEHRRVIGKYGNIVDCYAYGNLPVMYPIECSEVECATKESLEKAIYVVRNTIDDIRCRNDFVYGSETYELYKELIQRLEGVIFWFELELRRRLKNKESKQTHVSEKESNTEICCKEYKQIENFVGDVRKVNGCYVAYEEDRRGNLKVAGVYNSMLDCYCKSHYPVDFEFQEQYLICTNLDKAECALYRMKERLEGLEKLRRSVFCSDENKDRYSEFIEKLKLHIEIIEKEVTHIKNSRGRQNKGILKERERKRAWGYNGRLDFGYAVQDDQEIIERAILGKVKGYNL